MPRYVLEEDVTIAMLLSEDGLVVMADALALGMTLDAAALKCQTLDRK
jgi:hypothetical protein